MKEKGTQPSLFYEAGINLILKSKNTSQEKKIIDQHFLLLEI